MKSWLNTRSLIIGGITVGLALGVAWWLYANPSLATASRRTLLCMANANAGCLYRVVPIEERNALGLTEEKLERLLNDYVEPNLRIKKVYEIEVTSDPASGRATATGNWVLSSGQELPMSVSLYEGDDGYESPGLVTTLIALVAIVKFGDVGEEAGGIQKLMAWHEQARTDGPILKEMGIPGVYRRREEGLMTWTQWADYLEARLVQSSAAE